jgi:hypothetical protein
LPVILWGFWNNCNPQVFDSESFQRTQSWRFFKISRNHPLVGTHDENLLKSPPWKHTWWSELLSFLFFY